MQKLSDFLPEMKDKREGVRGVLKKVCIAIEQAEDGSNRETIIVTIKNKEKECPYIVRNNWDGSNPAHDENHAKRLFTAIGLLDKKIKTTVWGKLGKYKDDEWFCDIEEVN